MDCYLEKKDYDKILQFIHSIQCCSGDFMTLVMKSLVTTFSFEHVTFMVADNDGHFLELTGYKISEKMLRMYNEYYYKTDIFLPQNFTKEFNINFKKPVITTSDLMSPDRFENTEFYKDFLTLDNYYHQAVRYLRKGNRLVGGMSLIKKKDSGRFTEKELTILAIISPFISNCFVNNLEFIKVRQNQQLFSKCFAGMPLGAILLNNNLSVVMHNELALDYCRDIQKVNSRVADPVSEAVRNVLSGLQYQKDTITVPVHSLTRTYQFSIIPIFIPDRKNGIIIYFTIYIRPSSPSGVHDFAKKISDFGLTERETEIIEMIARGLNNKEIASKLFISYNTVRTHTGNVMTKLGVANRTAILSKLDIINMSANNQN